MQENNPNLVNNSNNSSSANNPSTNLIPDDIFSSLIEIPILRPRRPRRRRGNLFILNKISYKPTKIKYIFLNSIYFNIQIFLFKNNIFLKTYNLNLIIYI